MDCKELMLTRPRMVEQVDIPYQPAAAAVQGASGVRVDVAATDSRTTYRDRVSSKKNGYGMEMAAIVAKADVPASVAEAFRRELTARGFVMAPGGGTVQIELIRFYNDFKSGFWSGEAVANVAFNVKVAGANGALRSASITRALAPSRTFSWRAEIMPGWP